MTRRLLLGYLCITLFVLLVHDLPFGISMAGAERARLIAATQRDAAVLATYVMDVLDEPTTEDVEPSVMNYARGTGARVVIVDDRLATVIDTDPPSGRDAFLADVAASLDGTDQGSIRSTPSGQRVEVAVPVASGGVVHGSVWVSSPWNTRWPWRRRLLVLAGADAVTLLAVAVFGRLVANSLTSPLRALRQATAALAQGHLDSRADPGDGPPEVRDLAGSFNVMADQLSELVDAQRAFVADASHQLRTPLTALKLRLRQVAGHLSDDLDAAVALDSAMEETNRLHRLVEGLLSLARAEGARPEAVRQDLAAIIGGRIDTWAPLAAERDVALVERVIERSEILAVPGSMEQIIDNLVANALEVAPPGSELRLATIADPDGGRVELHVVDRGPGLGPDERQAAFTRFWRRSAGPHESGGSGLGLAIVAQLAVANGGLARLDASPGGGIDAVVSVPAAPARRRAHRSPPRRSRRRVPAVAAGRADAPQSIWTVLGPPLDEREPPGLHRGVMHVWIDQKRCVGNGICEELCPELFDYDGDLAFVLGADGARLGHGAAALAVVEDHLAEAVFEAVEACPGGCIHVTD